MVSGNSSGDPVMGISVGAEGVHGGPSIGLAAYLHQHGINFDLG